MPLSVLIWVGVGVICAVTGALAARRFAAAVRASGGSLLTDQERRELFYERPIGSFPTIVADDLAGFDQVLRRQSDPKAERWRRVTVSAWAATLLVIAFPFVARSLFGGIGTTPAGVTSNLVFIAALIVAAFWVAQLWFAIVRRRRVGWLVVCVVGIAAAVSVALVSSWLG